MRRALGTQRGFTLIELLVVISIIGMLASVVLVALQGAKQKGVFAAAQTFSHNLESTLYSNALVYLDFDSMTTLDQANLISNNTGTLAITGSNWHAPASIMPDTTLYKRGNQLNVPLGTIFPVPLTVPNINKYILDSNLLTSSFTFATWYKPTGALTPNQADVPLVEWDLNGNGAVLGVATDASGNVSGIYVNIPSGSGTLATTMSASLPLNQWAHVAMSVKSSGSGNVVATVYLNGKILGTFPTSVTPYTASNAWYVVLGGLGSGVNGNLDDVGIYGVSATAADIKQIYAEGASKHGLALVN